MFTAGQGSGRMLPSGYGSGLTVRLLVHMYICRESGV